MVDDDGLENRIPVMSGDVGSNPTASAKFACPHLYWWWTLQRNAREDYVDSLLRS